MIYYNDCRHFEGHIPCKQHKQYGVHCESCEFYDKTDKIILIIKLGAIGDVIRTSPLLHKIKEMHPNAKVWWITYSPDVIPSLVDKVLTYSHEALAILQATEFDILINLDKDAQASALAKTISAKEKYGFTLKNGYPAAINEKSEHKFLTGLFDDINLANKKSYLEEIFEICGWQFNGEEYIMEFDNSIKWDIHNYGKKIIGLNTGCGARWVSRLWADENWIELIKQLIKDGYHPLLLGGEQEHEKNSYFADQTGAEYLGYFPLKKFISLVNQCDLVVSAVTMGMHLAVALKKPLILMNNIFNPFEFELYGRGELVQPDKECHCFFSPSCKHDEYFCMNHLPVEKIYNSIKKFV